MRKFWPISSAARPRKPPSGRGYFAAELLLNAAETGKSRDVEAATSEPGEPRVDFATKRSGMFLVNAEVGLDVRFLFSLDCRLD
jgi:hypothetical protein